LGVDTSQADTPNWADSFLRLQPVVTRSPTGAIEAVELKVVDHFTPYRKIWLDDNDLDLAAAGPVVIPGTRYLVGGGKSGIVYVLDRYNMGQTDQQHSWNSAAYAQVPLDAIAKDYPDDAAADHVVQKFQAAFHQYIPDGSPYLPRAGAPVAAAMQNCGIIGRPATARGPMEPAVGAVPPPLRHQRSRQRVPRSRRHCRVPISWTLLSSAMTARCT
jgi:hypothetical protein